MTAKCSKCGAVFEYKAGISLIHVGAWKYTKCPACGKSSMMNTSLQDPVTSPEPAAPPRREPGDLVSLQV